jgi:mannosylfructose-phosphate synthase
MSTMADTANTYDPAVHEQFIRSKRTHVLMITNHGVHEWKVVPGMPDTGGQNVYVNQFTEALLEQGYRVTICNRGGYPHPSKGTMQSGLIYHPSGWARIMYLEDSKAEFVRKEDMDEQIPALVDDLNAKLDADQDAYDIIISHYWDAGKIGYLINERHSPRVPHVWIPHSLGALKKRNMDPSTWANLRIDERIAEEKAMLPYLDGAVCTSSAIRETFANDYGYEAKYFLPPCVNEKRYQPRSAEEIEPVWAFLAQQCPLDAAAIKQRKLVMEVSRTDKTKRKDVLIRAFAQARKEVPEALLAVSIDPHAEALHGELLALIKELQLEQEVIVLGSIWEQLPMLYCAAHVFCTPSVMEGFGMTAQESAASGRPVIASNLVPFVVEYLLGASPEKASVSADGQTEELLVGEGAIVVPADFVPGFANALVRVLKDEDFADSMGKKAYEITIPYFTWRHLTEQLLGDLGVTPERKEA